jgi:hypothetical protein
VLLQPSKIRSYSERAEALEKARRKAQQDRDARTANLQREIEAARTRCDTLIATAEREHAEARQAAADGIVKDWYGEALPLVRSYMLAPGRAAALPLGKVFRDLDVRCQRDLGEPLNDHLVAHAFVAELRQGCPQICNALQDGISTGLFGGGPASHAVAFAAAARSGDVAAMTTALASLEALLQRYASAAMGEPAEQATETHDKASRAVAHLDEARALEALHRERSGWRPPPVTSQYDARPVTVVHHRVQLAPGSDLGTTR